MRLTLEEIGRLANVSRSTVSRVINNQEGVSPEARARVKEVIARTGFTPNLVARSLASNRTGVIGLVIPSHVHNLFADPYFSVLIQGISRASNKAGTTLSMFLFETEEEELDVYPRVVASGFVDGVILTASRMNDPLIGRLQDGGLPWVMVGRPEGDSDISYVDADNFAGARSAAVHLCNLGYRRIGYLGAPESTTAGMDRLAGFRTGLAACGIDLDDDLYIAGDYSEASGYAGMRHLMSEEPRAVFVASDTMAVGALRALREAGLQVPQDVALASFDGFATSESVVPALTTVRQPVSEAGERAMFMLLDLISGTAIPPLVELLPTELIVRDSCGASRAHAPEQSPALNRS